MVGGIVGVKKYLYDVFGSAVNVAARMEGHSDALQINCSEATFLKAKNQFSFTPREPIEVKGVGTEKMYFLDIN